MPGKEASEQDTDASTRRAGDTAAIATALEAARVSRQPYSPPSAAVPLDVHAAYAIQRHFVALRSGDRIAGYKTAVNAAAAQQRLGLAAPVTGVLFASGQRAPDGSIARADFRSLAVETEIGFRLHRRLASAVTDAGALRDCADCCAVIELADPGFGRARITGVDLIAANAASAGFIAGAAVPASGIDVNALQVRLARDGLTLHEARASDLMGDQWRALAWLVNAVITRGHVVEPGDLLITGALGAPQAGVSGRYMATFGALGDLQFTVHE